jgi:hypothetical protein
MEKSANSFARTERRGDLALLIALAIARLLIQCLTDGRYGFHRDELGVLDDARFLDWGYVSYPPFTPFVARIALILFGSSLVGLRFFAVFAQSIAMVIAGLMARELGGRRPAQVVAALATAISPMSVCMGSMFQYITFDFLWWVLAAFFVIRLLRTEEPRWWLAIGATLGLGMMTKYTMLFFIAGLVAGVMFTPARRYLKSPWLWAGAALSLGIFAPNIYWQIRHHFVSLTFLNHIHARDVKIGRTNDFLLLQPFANANLVTLPLWLAGLWFYFLSPGGRCYRALGWMYLVPLLLFLFARGRAYYLAPAYPMLFAAGALWWDNWLAQRAGWARRLGWVTIAAAFCLGAAFSAVTMMPLAPINSAGWRLASKLHDDFSEQIGWPQFTQTVVQIYQALPPNEKSHTVILAGNYGEAGALDLYGRNDLPPVISGINTFWWRGYGRSSPEVVILVGFSRESAERFAQDVELAGHITNPYGVSNEETREHPEIFVCRRFKKPWPDFWKDFQRFG